MYTLFLLSAPSALAAGFGGAHLGGTAELDANGAEFLLELDVEPVRSTEGKNRVVWAPFEVAMILGESNPVASIDRIELSVLQGTRGFETSLVQASYRAGSLDYDVEAGFLDITAGEGGVRFPIWGDLIQGQLGLDLRTRFLFPEEEGTSILLSMGIPFEIGAYTPQDRPQFASLDVGLRPGIRLIGETPMTFQTYAKTAVGYAIVQASDVEIKTALTYEFHYDNATIHPRYWAHRFNVGFSVLF